MGNVLSFRSNSFGLSDELPADEVVASLGLAAFLDLREIFAFALTSSEWRRLCRQAFRAVRVQALGGKDPATKLLRLAQSALTCHGEDIREINAAFCRSMSNTVLKALPKLTALQSLNLDMCQHVDDEGLAAVAQRFTGLRSFSLYWNSKVTDEGLGRVLRAQKGRDLRHLCFSGCKNVSDETVQRVVGKAPQLETLDLTRCPRVTDNGAQLVCECLDRLKILRFYAMAQLAPAAFISLGRLVLLEELDLCGCRVEDGPIVELLTAAAPSRLHTLNLTWCAAITDATAMAVARDCPLLRWLSYFGNTHISAAAVEALAAGPAVKRLDSLDLRGLTKAQEYATNSKKLRLLFPALQHTELHH